MKQLQRETFAECFKRSAHRAAETLFAKARLANAVAKIARDRRSRDLAYEVKVRCLEAARRVKPEIFRRFPDHQRRRWVVRMKRGGAMHGRRMDADS